MKLPRFWAKEEGEAKTPAGKPVRFATWRWSHASVEEARGRARDALAGIARRIEQGQPFPDRYAYESRPVREEVIREIDGNGEEAAAITRNSYGALVLNTAGVMFVDADQSGAGSGGGGGGLLASLFGRKPAEDPSVARAKSYVSVDPAAAIRVYRTAAGTRYLFTHALFDPTSEAARSLMEHLGADPKYVQLCNVQESFRARLTPKPWRCGESAPTVRWPWADEEAEAAMRDWLARYEDACEGKAVCALLDTVGSGRVHPAVAPIVRLHDEMTGAGTAAPLA